MAINYRGSGIYTGLSSDTKPTSGVATNALFIETNTGRISKYNGTSWDLLINNNSSVSKTSAYTLTAFDSVILASASGGAFTLTLPAASGVSGKIYEIKKTDSTENIVTVDANSSETIDGLLTWELRSSLAFLKIISDGTNWHVLDYRVPTLLSQRRKGTTEDRWYIAGLINGGAMSTGTATFDNLFATPFIVSTPSTLNAMAVNVTTSAPSSTVRLGVYRDSNLYPSTLVTEAGEVATATDNTFASVTLGSNVTLQPGLYWFVIAVGVASPTLRHIVNTQALSLGNRSNAGDTSSQIGWVHAFTYAALPATFPSSSPTTSTTNRPAIYARFI